MDSKHLYASITGLLILLSSCLTTKPFHPNIQPQEIADVLKFETISYVSFIEHGNRGVFNDSLSKTSKSNFDEILIAGNYVPLTGMVNSKDTTIKKRLEVEMQYLFLTAGVERKVSALKLTPTLDSVLEANGKRFGLLTMTSGFTRRKGNYGGQVAKGTAVGLLTLGMVVPTPIKSNSTISAMIIDAKENNVSYYKTHAVADVEPLDRDIIRRQLNSVFYNLVTGRR